MISSRSDLERCLRALPGFDPYANAEGFSFDYARGNKPVKFIEMFCTHVEGEVAGRPYELAWHELSIVLNLFGWVDARGLRRFREVLYYVSRKNSKSTLFSAIGLFLLMADDEPGAQILSAAGDQNQSGIIHRIMTGMIDNDAKSDEPWLAVELKPLQVEFKIKHPASGSFYKALTASVANKHGGNAHAVLFDELQAQRDAGMYETLRNSMIARRQPLFANFTTADYDRPSICNRVLDYSRNVRDGGIGDPRLLPAIYEVPKDADWKDESLWPLANPNLGRSIQIDALRQLAMKAEHDPTFLNEFRRQHLNQVTGQREAWVPVDRLDLCPAIRKPEPRGRCYLAADLSSTTDLSAVVAYFPDDDHTIDLVAWVCDGAMRKRDKMNRDLYSAWIEAGYLRLIPGESIIHGMIEEAILDLARRFDVRQVAFDRYNAHELTIRLLNEHKLPVSMYPQTCEWMHDPCQELARLIATRELNWQGNPLFRWSFGNCSVYRNTSGHMKIERSNEHAKVDPVVAAVMAIGAKQLDTAAGPSVYETRGLLYV